MNTSEKLLDFFRSEFSAEEQSGFARLKRVPDSHVEECLAYYQSLSADEKPRWVDCAAHYAHKCFGFITGAPDFDHTKHPYFQRWSDSNLRFPFRSPRNVPMLRVAVFQYKIDAQRGMPSCISEETFRLARSVKSIKAKELRKRVGTLLGRFDYQKIDDHGGNCCTWDSHQFQFNADFGSRMGQLHYSVTPWEFRDGSLGGGKLCFESALGMGWGNWDFIVEENVDEVFALLEELIKYAVELPQRIRAAA